MKRLLMAVMAVLALVGAAHGLEDDFQEQLFRLNHKLVRVWTDVEGAVEMRYVPGWQLLPECRDKSKWGDECNGGQGFLFFEGRNSGEATLDGEARTDACPEWFPAYADSDKRGRLTIYQVNSKGGVMRNSKCNVVLQPVKR
jgi:hypothetical protein